MLKHIVVVVDVYGNYKTHVRDCPRPYTRMFRRWGKARKMFDQLVHAYPRYLGYRVTCYTIDAEGK